MAVLDSPDRFETALASFKRGSVPGWADSSQAAANHTAVQLLPNHQHGVHLAAVKGELGPGDTLDSVTVLKCRIEFMFGLGATWELRTAVCSGTSPPGAAIGQPICAHRCITSSPRGTCTVCAKLGN